MWIKPSPKDWPHPEGVDNWYQETCCNCGSKFLGPKNAPVCHECKTAWEKKWISMTPEEQHKHTLRLTAEVQKYFNDSQVQKVQVADGAGDSGV